MPKPDARKRVTSRIRKAAAGDLEAVLEIENEQFSHPWPENHYRAELGRGDGGLFVYDEADGRVTGFILFWMMAQTVELQKIAVRGSCQGRGIAGRLLDFMLTLARQGDVDEVFLEVRRSNRNAIRLYEKYGFRKSGERQGYYQNPIEDAWLYTLRLKK